MRRSWNLSFTNDL